jgi:hypothetical protein
MKMLRLRSGHCLCISAADLLITLSTRFVASCSRNSSWRNLWYSSHQTVFGCLPTLVLQKTWRKRFEFPRWCFAMGAGTIGADSRPMEQTRPVARPANQQRFSSGRVSADTSPTSRLHDRWPLGLLPGVADNPGLKERNEKPARKKPALCLRLT